MSHTPGPWHSSVAGDHMRDDYSQPFVITQYGQANLVAGVFGDVAGGEKVAEANARLIAAAPDLLSALDSMVRIVSTHDGFGVRCPSPSTDRPTIDAAISVLKKARGQ